MNEKIYVGKGMVVGQYGNIGFSVDLDALLPHAYEYNGKRYVKLIMSEMRQADQYGKTHTVQIDTWKPDTAAGAVESQKQQQPPTQPLAEIDILEEDINTEEIPF
ncbi:MAG: hypothetical protein A2Z88_04910 [Omnitrophica WOR_2 bacterium GWA2_47_8]|nr:MAG: hypothetical protein A2Z88_04910 [Omnitrophica WOR_2 bacterium GWA2_47_8]